VHRSQAIVKLTRTLTPSVNMLLRADFARSRNSVLVSGTAEAMPYAWSDDGFRECVKSCTVIRSQRTGAEPQSSHALTSEILLTSASNLPSATSSNTSRTKRNCSDRLVAVDMELAWTVCSSLPAGCWFYDEGLLS